MNIRKTLLVRFLAVLLLLSAAERKARTVS